jgi:uncharacterized protein DUF6968
VKNLVAKVEVTGVRAGGERLAIKVEIGRPRQERDGRWACSIAVAPLRTRFDDVRGADSFHAVWLACGLTLKLLGNLKAEGWQLLNGDGSEFPLDAYLSGLDASG